MTRRISLYQLGVALAGASLFASTTMAEFEIYKKGDTSLHFNFEVQGAGFANSNSWFGESKAFLGDNTNTWAELGVEPGLSFQMPAGKGVMFGELSWVYTDTYSDDASGLTIGLDDTDETTLEQAHIGWAIENPFAGLEDDTFSIIGGRQDYNIGTGLIINDGAANGGERGGWWLGLRKTFKDSVIVRLDSKQWLVEGFRLENRPRRGGTRGKAYGGNVEYTFGDTTTLGGTYLQVNPHISGADNLDVFSGRADWQATNGFGLAGEYVHEDSDQIDADGWYAQVSYQVQGVPWSPVLSYRYAHFDGDDPNTSKDEGFREIAYGFTDYGYWYQGEITGNYPLGNSNLISHLVRVEAQPREDLTLNLLYYNFKLDEPESLDFAVTDDDWGDEINFTADWEATDRIYIIGVAGVLFPGKAAKQWVGGDENWLYSMLYASYSF